MMTSSCLGAKPCQYEHSRAPPFFPEAIFWIVKSIRANPSHHSKYVISQYLRFFLLSFFPKVTTTRWNCFLFLMMCCFIGMRTVWLGCPHHFQLRIRLAFNFSFYFSSPNKCTISVYYYAWSFISSILCLWLYLFPLVASKHLTTGFIIFSAFKIGYCLLLSGTEP